MDISDLAESEKGGVSVITGWKISKIDAANKIAELDTGYQIHYDKCLIATGNFSSSDKNFSIYFLFFFYFEFNCF